MYKIKFHYRIIALFMAFTVVLSTAGIAISKHICNDVVEKIAINHSPEPCDHQRESTTIDCPVHGKMEIAVKTTDDNCCQETTDYIIENNPKNLDISEITIDPQLLVLYFTTFVDFHFNNFDTNSLNYNNLLKTPPLLNQKIPVLIQSFLL